MNQRKNLSRKVYMLLSIHLAMACVVYVKIVLNLPRIKADSNILKNRTLLIFKYLRETMDESHPAPLANIFAFSKQTN